MKTATYDIDLHALVIRETTQPEGMSRKLAIEITGGLSNPSKMPGWAWGTPAWDCITGSKLAQIEGTVCFKCYARVRAYSWPAVRAAYARRRDRFSDPRWVDAMVWLIRNSGDEYFRWFDSGDLQSVEQLTQIIVVCRQLPKVHFWLPTREYKTVQDYLAQGGTIPGNLVIRLSAHMVDGDPPAGYGLPTSTVHSKKGKPVRGKECRAYTRGNRCGDCRLCWDKTIANVSYIEK